MKYQVKEISRKDIWEKFSLETSPNTFLQSWNWGAFNQSLNRKIWRHGIFEGSKLMGINLTVKQDSRFGPFLYSPRGPILNWSNPDQFRVLSDTVINIGHDEKCIFWKADPPIADSEENRKIFQKEGFKSAVTFVQVEDAWLLPLDKSEDELLADMRKTTRYLIRKEPKDGIQIEVSDSVDIAKKFVSMLSGTANRKSFTNHSDEYYLKQFEIFGKEGQEKIYIAKKNNKILAMAMIMFYGEMGNYLHAASDPDEGRSVGYFLQWEAIKEAKKRGCKYYNFWGVVKDKNFKPSHPWYGFSLFKRGFGGFKYSYIRAQDYSLSPKYELYRAAERLRRLLDRLVQGYWED